MGRGWGGQGEEGEGGGWGGGGGGREGERWGMDGGEGRGGHLFLEDLLGWAEAKPEPRSFRRKKGNQALRNASASKSEKLMLKPGFLEGWKRTQKTLPPAGMKKIVGWHTIISEGHCTKRRGEHPEPLNWKQV